MLAQTIHMLVGRIVNRLTAFFPRAKQIAFADRLHSTIDKLISTANTKNIGGLSDFFSQIIHLSSSYVHEAVRKLIPVYREFFRKDMLRATEIFDLHFGSYLCGMDSLFGHHATKEQKQAAKMLFNELVKLINFTELKSSWKKAHTGSFNKRIVQQRYEQFLDLLENNLTSKPV